MSILKASLKNHRKNIYLLNFCVFISDNMCYLETVGGKLCNMALFCRQMYQGTSSVSGPVQRYPRKLE